jgi:hypothetical protein
MGTWGTEIKNNDTTAEIYSIFYDSYNKGQNPINISVKLIEDNQELINNPYDCNNFWFALALAQWETKSLDSKIFERVKNIIESENELQVWKELDADEKDIDTRKIVLEKFLRKLQTDKPKAKPRVKATQRIVKPIFEIGDCLTFKYDNGNYGGIVILGVNDDTEHGYNLVAGTRINQSTKPIINDFEKAEILIRNYASWKNDEVIVWTWPNNFKKLFSDFFELIGKVMVSKKYKTDDNNFGYVADWGLTKLAATLQFEYEKTNSRPTNTITVEELTKKKKW